MSDYMVKLIFGVCVFAVAIVCCAVLINWVV